jgi:putative transposase
MPEARVGQRGSLAYIWADTGSRSRDPRDQRYDWAYLSGTVWLARGAGAALVLPFVSTAAMNPRLTEISTQVAPGAHAVITLDGAGWRQVGGKPKLTDSVSLLPVAPYLPGP